MSPHFDLLAKILVHNYFIDSRCILIISDQPNGFSPEYDLLVPVIKVSKVDEALLFHYFGFQEIIIEHSKALTIFKELEFAMRRNIERFNKRKYIFIPSEESEEDLMTIFNLTETDFITNLLILEGNDSVIKIITNKYIGNDYRDPIILDYFFGGNQSFKFKTDLFPNKLKDHQGKHLNMATFNYEPYSIVGKSIENHKGSEMKTALEFAFRYNFTPELVVNKNDYWGEIFKNWTGLGLLGNVVEDKADIGFAALYTWENVYPYLDPSMPLIRTGITCLVPAPKLACGWFAPLLSFSTEMWRTVLAMYISTNIIMVLMNFCYRRVIFDRKKESFKSILGKSTLSIYKSYVLQTVQKVEIPFGYSGYIFMALIFLLCLLIASFYNSGLASILTVPRYLKPIDTPEDFVNSGLYWMATQDAWIFSIQTTHEPIYKSIVDHFIALPEEDELRELSKTNSYAFSVERLPKQNFAIGEYIQQDIIDQYHLMSQDFYWEQCLFYLRKNSILLDLVNIFVLRAFEAGLITHWQDEAVTLVMDSQVQKALKYYQYQKEHIVNSLNWGRIKGAFAVLFIGYLLSFVFFCLEIMTHYKTKLKYIN